jgi:hypothetical protein
MEPIGEEYQRYSHAQWQDAHQQADSIDFHEAKMMEGAASTLSHGGASTDSLEYVYSPGDDDPILQQKKASPDDSANEWNGGFAKRGWSRSLNGFSNSTLANTYLDRSLTAFQRKQLCDCYADISKLSNGLEVQELHDQVADLFNRRHVSQFSDDQCGYGGLIRATRVAEFFKEQGSVLLQGRLGVRAFPYLAVAPTPILPTSIGPTRSTMYASTATILPPAIHYAHQAHFDLTIPTSLEIERYSRQKCRTTLQEIGWSTFGDLEVLRRRILQYYKLKVVTMAYHDTLLWHIYVCFSHLWNTDPLTMA